jgi:hypothetical protein
VEASSIGNGWARNKKQRGLHWCHLVVVVVSPRPRPCLGGRWGGTGAADRLVGHGGPKPFSKSSCLGQRVRIPVPSCSTLPAIERRHICVVAAIVRWARRWQEHGWANPPAALGSSALGPSRVLHKKKSTRAASAQPSSHPFPAGAEKAASAPGRKTFPPPALLVPINVQCISPSEQRLVLGCFYPTRPDKGPSTHAQPVTSSLLPTASPEDCMLRKTQHKPDNVLR